MSSKTTKGVYRFEFSLNIGILTAMRTDRVTVGDLGYENEEWDAISEEQRQKELDSYLEEWANGYIEINWQEV